MYSKDRIKTKGKKTSGKVILGEEYGRDKAVIHNEEKIETLKKKSS